MDKKEIIAALIEIMSIDGAHHKDEEINKLVINLCGDKDEYHRVIGAAFLRGWDFSNHDYIVQRIGDST